MIHNPDMALEPKWVATVDDGISNATWDGYDKTIRTEVTDYNHKFISQPGYVTVNWLLCKAMVWTESGGPDRWYPTFTIGSTSMLHEGWAAPS